MKAITGLETRLRAAVGESAATLDGLVLEAADEIRALRARVAELEYVAGLMWDRYEDGEPCYEGMTDDEIKEQIVNPWRDAHPKTVEFWHDLEDACMGAVATPGKITRVRAIAFKVKDKFLGCRLPSGRMLYYYDPLICPCLTSWGDTKDCVTYMTVDGLTKKWVRTNTYGGKIAENVTQAVARDIMAAGMLNAEAAGYKIVASVHDELLAEVPEGFGSVEEFEGLMCKAPAWAAGLPLKAAGWRGRRYRK